ncbi:vanomycin resistance protein VanB, partial [Micromonospora yasonensis]|nr:vanomycin resistance protein VanB [Micromonospora yasonensis]
MTLYGEKLPPADDRPTVKVTAVSWPDDEPEPGVAPGPLQPDRGAWFRRGRVLLAGGIAAAVLAAGVGAGAWAYAGDVPRGTTVLGAELGGRSRAEAARALRAELDRRSAELNAPIKI